MNGTIRDAEILVKNPSPCKNETYQKCFRDFEIMSKFSETNVFRRYHSPPLALGEKATFRDGPLFFDVGGREGLGNFLGSEFFFSHL